MLNLLYNVVLNGYCFIYYYFFYYYVYVLRKVVFVLVKYFIRIKSGDEVRKLVSCRFVLCILNLLINYNFEFLFRECVCFFKYYERFFGF